ncbi:MAG: hypothetical protein HY901_11255 [Deltaproteobacteria bacterium]|nr:hypothetical protein [Deltaproteobacteria bacterium]
MRYQDLEWRGRNLGDLVEHLTRKKVARDQGAHFDPDLQPRFRTRAARWRPLLGQCAAAQGHFAKPGSCRRRPLRLLGAVPAARPEPPVRTGPTTTCVVRSFAR